MFASWAVVYLDYLHKLQVKDPVLLSTFGYAILARLVWGCDFAIVWF